jgi:muconate cycloisomerase
MRITAVESVLVDVPLREPVQGVHGTTAVQRSVLVRVAAGAGGEGWGNVDPTPGYSAVSAELVCASVTKLAPAMLGADAANLRGALSLMDRAVGGASEAKAAIEMALLDLKARALGVAAHDLLGGRVKDAVTLNAWIGTVPPAQAAREALAWCARGFRTRGTTLPASPTFAPASVFRSWRTRA